MSWTKEELNSGLGYIDEESRKLATDSYIKQQKNPILISFKWGDVNVTTVYHPLLDGDLQQYIDSDKYTITYCGLEKRSSRESHKLKITGSNPVPATKKECKVAQEGEHLNSTWEVTG